MIGIKKLEEAIREKSGTEGIWLPELAQREKLRAERTPEKKKQRRGGTRNRKRKPHGRHR